MAFARPFGSLRARLLATTAVTLALFVGAMAANLQQLRRVDAGIRVVNEVYLPLGALTTRMGGLVERDLDEPLAATVAEAARVTRRADGMEVDPEERAALTAAARQVDAIEAARHAWQAAELPNAEGRARLRDAILQLAVLVDGRVGAMATKTVRAQEATVRFAITLLAVGGLGGLLALWWTGSALRPVTRLTEQVRQVSEGRRDVRIEADSDDEIGTLAAAFAQMVDTVLARDRSLAELGTWLRRILDSLGAAVVVVEDGVVRFGNPASRALWGAEEGAPLPRPVDTLPEGRHELAEGGRHQEVTVRPFGTTGRILVGDDTTARVHDRERLQRSERLALVGQMLAQVTHEVRNPLNAISLHVELVADEVESPEGRALVDTIQREVRRLESVTERYLDLVRRPSGEPAPVDPLALAREVAALEQAAFQRAGAELRVEGRDAGPAEIDADLVRRALLNLVRNAREAGARTVTLRVRRGDAETTFEVTDDGPGMPPEVQARVFDPFFTTRPRGTGLGLAIARQGVEDAGGTIAVDSAPGRGTTFRVRLPD